MLLYTTIIFVSYFSLYKIHPSKYFLTILFLSVLEETIVYMIGGGIHGTATSIWEDYAKSIPIFMTHATLWKKHMEKYEYSQQEIFIMAGLHGFFFEIILTGIILNPQLLLIFGGTPFLIYGILVIIPKTQQKQQIHPTTPKKIALWTIYLTIEICIGIIAHIIYDSAIDQK